MILSGLNVQEPSVLSMPAREEAISNLNRALLRPRAGQAASSSSFPIPPRLAGAPAVARAIEHGIAVWSEGKAKPYARKLYSVLAALRCEDRLLQRHEPWELAFLKEESLIREESTVMQQSLASLTAKLDSLEAQLKTRISQPRRACPRCGSKDMERISVQTRSADEGMTMMLQCTSCQQRVRI